MTATDTDRREAVSFANHVISDWDYAMDGFFNQVERKRVAQGLTTQQVFAALETGYGDAVADNWLEWVEEN